MEGGNCDEDGEYCGMEGGNPGVDEGYSISLMDMYFSNCLLSWL